MSSEILYGYWNLMKDGDGRFSDNFKKYLNCSCAFQINAEKTIHFIEQGNGGAARFYFKVALAEFNYLNNEYDTKQLPEHYGLLIDSLREQKEFLRKRLTEYCKSNLGGMAA